MGDRLGTPGAVGFLFLFLMPSCRRFGSKNAYPECLSRMPIQILKNLSEYDSQKKFFSDRQIDPPGLNALILEYRGIYLFSHAVPSAENCSKVFLLSSSTRWQFFNFDVNGIFLTYIQLCQLPNSNDKNKVQKFVAKKPEPSTLLKPPLRKSQDIFSAISFQPYSATCWKQFQSVPLLEVYKMTALDFDVNGFFLT